MRETKRESIEREREKLIMGEKQRGSRQKERGKSRDGARHDASMPRELRYTPKEMADA